MGNYLTLLFLLFSVNLLGQNKDDFYLKEKSHDFGEVSQGDVVQWILEFENRGKDTLMIEKVRTECGCTTPEWDTTAVYPPGSNGIIKIILNTKEKHGIYNKNVFIQLKNNLWIPIPIRANILPRKVKSSYK